MSLRLLTSTALALVLATSGAVRAGSADPTLIGYWPIYGNALDFSGYGNDGTVFGATLTAGHDGAPDGAYLFDGTSTYIQVPDSPSLASPTTGLTQMAWVRPDDWSLVGSTFGPILMKSTTSANTLQYRMALVPGGLHSAYDDYNIGSTQPFTIEFGTWYHVAAVFDAGTVTHYVNGVALGSETLTISAMTPNAMPLDIGRDVPGYTEFWNGAIDDVRLYARALSAVEIQAIASVLPTSTTVTSSSTTTSSTMPPGSVVLLPGNKLLVKQKKSGVQRLQLIVRDPAVTAALPCEVDGELTLEAAGAGAPAMGIPLAASLWRPIKAKKPEKGCKYRKGPIVATVQVKAGKMLKVVAKADDLGIPLDADPRPVRIEVRHGDVRQCVEFPAGGPGGFKAGKKLLAKRAGVATGCPAAASPSGAFVD
jgi:hypothetical protein